MGSDEGRPNTSSAPGARLSEESALVDCIPCPALVVTADRRVAALNDPFCDAFGLKAAFFHIGEDFADFARRASLTGSPGLIALGDMMSGDGNLTKTDIIARNGNILEARACTTSDGKSLITLFSPEPATAENTDSLFCNIIENMPGTVLSLARSADGRLRCLYASRQSAALFGRGLAEITSPETDFRTFIAEHHLAEWDKALEVSAVKSEPFDVEFQIIDPASGERWVRGIGNASRGTDGAATFYIRILDIEDRRKVVSDRQRLEKLLDLVVDNIPACISVRNLHDNSYVIVNRAYEELTGRNRADVIGKSDIRLFPEMKDRIRDQESREMIEKGQIADLPEVRVKTPHKGYRVLKTKKCPLFDETETTRYILSICEDVTEQRLAENALDQTESGRPKVIDPLTT